jgi:hypothetical protein
MIDVLHCPNCDALVERGRFVGYGAPVSSPESGSRVFVLCFQHPLEQGVEHEPATE